MPHCAQGCAQRGEVAQWQSTWTNQGDQRFDSVPLHMKTVIDDLRMLLVFNLIMLAMRIVPKNEEGLQFIAIIKVWTERSIEKQLKRDNY